MEATSKILHVLRLVPLLLATSCTTWKLDTAKPEFVNRENLVAALRTDSTVTVVVDEWLMSGLDDKSWPRNAELIVGNIFGYAKMRTVDSGAGVTVRLTARFNGVSADYGHSPFDPQPRRMMTGGHIEGRVTFLKGDVVVGKLSFKGYSPPPSSATPGGIDPVIEALSSSNFYEDFLGLLAQARGPETLQRIVDEDNQIRMRRRASSGFDGHEGAYRAVFRVLAKSSEDWARAMLIRLSNDTESPSTKSLAQDALQTRETRTRR